MPAAPFNTVCAVEAKDFWYSSEELYTSKKGLVEVVKKVKEIQITANEYA